MTSSDPSRQDGPQPDRRAPRPLGRGRHPSLFNRNKDAVQPATPNDFLGLDVEVQRSRERAEAEAQAEPQPMHVFLPPVPDTRVSTNTTLIPRSALQPRAPQAPLPSSGPSPHATQHATLQQHLYAAQQHAPQQHAPQQHVPQQHAPQQHAPQQHVPQQHVPQQQAPQPRAPQTHAPQTHPPPHPPAGFLDPRLGEGYGAPPPAPRVRSNSWLLSLDDARSGRAGVGPVVHDPSRRAPELAAPAPLDASFAEAPPVSSRTVPWLVRGLIGAAAASFLFVVGSTVLSPMRTEQKVEYVPPHTTTHIRAESPPQLADPGPRASTTPEPEKPLGRRTTLARPVAQSPARPSLPPAATAPARDEEPPTFIEVAPPEFAPNLDPNAKPPVDPNAEGAPNAQRAAVLPAWDPAMVSAPPLARNELGPNPDELAASPARKARVQSFLMSQSRGASPLEDANAEYTTPVLAGFTGIGAPPARTVPATASTPRAGGVWDGAVVPVDQIDAKLRILTPKVGLVRVTLASGDVREGRLHAVGEGQIWLERDGAPESIARARVERLEQIGGAQDAPAKTPAPLDDKRVRVRTQGGLFYGTIVARDGDSITLLTDEGARVTIEGGSVERAPERKTVVKHETAPKPKPKPDPVPAAHRDPGLEDAAANGG